MADGEIWTVNNVNCYIDNSSDVTIGTAVSVESLVSAATSIVVQLKNVKIQEPNTKAEQIGTLGIDSRGYRNAHKGYSRSEMASIKGDMVVIKGADKLSYLAADSTAAVGATGYTRILRGTASPKDVTFIVELDDGTDAEYIMLHKATAVFNELDIDDGETHAKYSFEAMCLPTNYYDDLKN